ncbi:hypothetical protein F6X51_19665 [Methylobacterium planeticum]|uniref:Uncharacterized protein n=1 Tax=Methylobacterium planeticum TaxID=2615211 RepID=A0A6N6MNR5_9HYPH|nr:hypothetical protein F6X51_19665 [Methylobacterium planeticum]
MTDDGVALFEALRKADDGNALCSLAETVSADPDGGRRRVAGPAPFHAYRGQGRPRAGADRR